MARQTNSSSFFVIRNFKSMFIRPEENYQSVDGLRAISVLLVIIFHCYFFMFFYLQEEKYFEYVNNFPVFLNWIWHSEKALDIFFVISGFLIGGILMREQKKNNSISLKGFYIKRFFRLTPVFLLSIPITMLVSNNDHNVWANLLYINNFLSEGEMFMPWSWSLAVEEQFYIVFSIFLVFLFYKRKLGIKTLILLFASSFIVRLIVVLLNWDLVSKPYAGFFLLALKDNYSPRFFDLLYDNLYTRYGALVCGVIIAYLNTYKQDSLKVFFSKKSYPMIINTISLMFITLLTLIPIQSTENPISETQNFLYVIFQRNIFSICIAFIIISSFYAKDIITNSITRFLSLKIWFPIAQLSYSMYLFHMPVLIIIYLIMATITKNGEEKLIGLSETFMLFIAVTITTMLLSIFTYVFVEKPFINIGHKYSSKTSEDISNDDEITPDKKASNIA